MPNQHNFPPPPYSYNDFRITYNETCFFYNGGFDLKCLISIKRHPQGVAAAVGRYPYKSYPSTDMIDLIFKTCIEYVNEKEYKDEEVCEIKKYSFEKKNDLTVKTTNMNVKRKLLKITSGEFNIKTIENFLSSSDPIKNEKNKTYISSSIEKLKTYVSSSLHFNNPKKIKINSSVIKDKDKK